MGRASLRQPKGRSVVEKLRILAEYEEAPHGQKGAVARRNGVDRRLMGRWAAARDQGEFGTGETGRRTSPSAVTPRTQSLEITRLRERLAKSEAENAVLKTAIETVGKAHALLQMVSESAEQNPLSPRSSSRPSPTSPPTD